MIIVIDIKSKKNTMLLLILLRDVYGIIYFSEDIFPVGPCWSIIVLLLQLKSFFLSSFLGESGARKK